MSLTILKPGLADSIQDGGRYGFQHIGVNPTGAMDSLAFYLANCLVGNYENEAAIECFFPASQILFNEDAIIAICGADFAPEIDNFPVEINKVILVKAFSILTFKKNVKGNVCYIAVRGGFKLNDWLQSKSTNTIVRKGGLEGRVLRKDDILYLNDIQSIRKSKNPNWQVNIASFYTNQNTIRIIAGEEISWLDAESFLRLVQKEFTISPKSNRMAYSLINNELSKLRTDELTSAAVVKGTVQLLPNGNLLALMADHQTTGGYPKIAQIAAVDVPSFVQQRPGTKLCFSLISIEEAERLYLLQLLEMRRLQWICKLKLEEFLYAH